MLRALIACMLATCVAGFQPVLSCRHAQRRGAAAYMAQSMADNLSGGLAAETLAKLAEGKFAVSVRELAAEGMTKSELEKAFKAALVAAYLDGAVTTVAPSPAVPNLELRRPATASDAQAAFRQAYTGRIITSPTQKFISSVIEDRAGAFSFKYSRVYAVGLAALCDTFLPATCLNPEDEAATRSALSFGIGLDAEQVAADAVALLAESAGKTKQEILAGADLRQVELQARAPAGFKYTYVFGVGLVTLMKMTGEGMTSKGKAGTWYAKAEGDGGPIDSWCGELGLDKYAKRLAQDTAAPLSIERVGTFELDQGGRPGLNLGTGLK